MLQAQRSGHGDLWPALLPAMPRGISTQLHRRHSAAVALSLLGLAGIAAAQLVEARYLRTGLLLHVGLLLTGAAILSMQGARPHRTHAAEAADVAHDLRGPLISLQATLELLAGDGFGTLPEPARAMAQRAAAMSGRAAEIADRTLQRSTADAAATRTAGTADLDVILREVAEALDVQVRATGATLALASLPRVRGDSSGLFRVFVNLLQNGLKYHQPDMPPRISVTAKTRDAWAEIAVSDQGIGIAPAERSRVFEHHYRTAAGAAHAAGKGLGLATVQRLVTEMGGTVWVDGTIPDRTTIMVRLPLG